MGKAGSMMIGNVPLGQDYMHATRRPGWEPMHAFTGVFQHLHFSSNTPYLNKGPETICLFDTRAHVDTVVNRPYVSGKEA